MASDLSVILAQIIVWVSQNRDVMLLASCFCLGAGGALLMARIPLQERLLDIPSDRSAHHTPMPRGGGVGILVAFLVAGISLRLPTTFLFAALLVSLVSFYGDFLRISIIFRLIVQLAASLIFLFPLLSTLAGYCADWLVGDSPLIFILYLLFLLLFQIGTTNFYNFMDGINGLAGFTGFIAFGLIGAYYLNSPLPSDPLQISLVWLSFCISVACLGFLPFNAPRARVFMGDVGSILLGFVFAALMIFLARNIQEITFFASCLFPFYADELTTMVLRLFDRENLFVSHRRHLYQILANEAGVTHWKIAAVYGSVQIMAVAGVFAAGYHSYWLPFLFLALCGLVWTALSLWIRCSYPSSPRSSIKLNPLNFPAKCGGGSQEI